MTTKEFDALVESLVLDTRESSQELVTAIVESDAVQKMVLNWMLRPILTRVGLESAIAVHLTIGFQLGRKYAEARELDQMFSMEE
jgi:hypothetical protein